MNEIVKLAAACILKRAGLPPFMTFLMGGRKPHENLMNTPPESLHDPRYTVQLSPQEREVLREYEAVNTLDQASPASPMLPYLAALIQYGTKDKSMVHEPGNYGYAGTQGYEVY